MSFKVTDFDTNWKLISDFLLVINTNLPPVLHRFWDIAFDRSSIAAFGYPCCVYVPRRRGSSGMISVKFFFDVSWWPTYQMLMLPKIWTAWVGCTIVTDRQTTGRRTGDSIANVNMSLRFAKIVMWFGVIIGVTGHCGSLTKGYLLWPRQETHVRITWSNQEVVVAKCLCT